MKVDDVASPKQYQTKKTQEKFNYTVIADLFSLVVLSLFLSVLFFGNCDKKELNYQKMKKFLLLSCRQKSQIFIDDKKNV